MAQYRTHNFLGTTESLCPQCLRVVRAKVVTHDGRVYFRKHCPEHGTREDFVCSDQRWFDRTDYSLPGKIPRLYGTEVSRGCPYDCGLCDEHEQHTCIGLLEVTSSCNLECPICFAHSGPGGDHLSVAQCRAAIDRLVEVEGQAEVLQLSGGEPTIHPGFAEILQYACDQTIDVVMINTNGIRIARDDSFVELLSRLRHRVEVYLQFDSFNDEQTHSLRGQSLVETKLRAIERLGDAGVRVTLVCTLQTDVNLDQVGPITEFAIARPWITGLSFQPATYSGRYVLPETLERRVTFPDVLTAIELQTGGVLRAADFSPLPCAHPNGHTLSYAFRDGGEILPLARFVDLVNHLDLLSGRITFDRERAKDLIGQFISRLCCSGQNDCGSAPIADHNGGDSARLLAEVVSLTGRLEGESQVGMAIEFLRRAMLKQLDPEDMFRVTTTSFMDAYNFDLRQLMKSCVHHVLPSGHIIPFSAYNVLYRDGHVPLPPIQGRQSRCESQIEIPELVQLGLDRYDSS